MLVFRVWLAGSFPSFKGSFVPAAGREQSPCSLWAGTCHSLLSCWVGGGSRPSAVRCRWLQPGQMAGMVPESQCLGVMLCVPVSRERWQGCPLGCSNWRMLQA